MDINTMVITANTSYHEPEALSSDFLCFKRNMIDRDFPLHMHDYYEIELVIEGHATHWLNGSGIPIAVGSLYMLSPEDVHRFSTDGTLRLLSIKVLDNMLPKDLQQLILLSRGGLYANLNGESFESAKRVFLDINAELMHLGPFCKPRCNAYLTLLVTGLLAVAQKVAPSQINKPVMSYLRTALDYINTNYQTSISLADAANACSMSPCYFSTFFTRHVGCNFSKYLMDYRLRKAQVLLIETDMSVLDIAFAAGFGSLSNFLRAFRRQYNMTPSKFRDNA